MTRPSRILLFRHGPAEVRGRVPDEERALTPRGRRLTAAAARGLALLVDGRTRIITSPARRARETADILAEVVGGPAPRVDQRLAPGATPADLLAALVAHRPRGGGTSVLVGHEPDLSGLVAVLVGLQGPGHLRLAKAGAVWLDADGAPHTARFTLRALLPRRVLRRLVRP